MTINEKKRTFISHFFQFSSILKRKCCRTYNHKLLCCIILFFLYYFGLFTHLFELDYHTEFEYPLHRNIIDCVHAISQQKPHDCEVINSYDFNFIIKNSNKCNQSDDTPITLVIIVKSSINNYDKRQAIRNSWGFEKRFYDIKVKRVFMIGISDKEDTSNIRKEQLTFGDIVQTDFIDSYYNNTIKTMMSYKWATLYCSDAKFYFFVDDDMYVSVKNIIRFIRNPTQYPQYLEKTENKELSKHWNKITHYELPDDVKLYSGFVTFTQPQRHQCSKWYVSLNEYPYDKWPPYVSAGSYILSKEVLKLMYYASYFTKHFRFDDIYVALLAKKLHIEPFHCPEFYVFKKPYNRTTYKYVLSSHGFHTTELLKIWNEQKILGNA